MVNLLSNLEATTHKLSRTELNCKWWGPETQAHGLSSWLKLIFLMQLLNLKLRQLTFFMSLNYLIYTYQSMTSSHIWATQPSNSQLWVKVKENTKPPPLKSIATINREVLADSTPLVVMLHLSTRTWCSTLHYIWEILTKELLSI